MYKPLIEKRKKMRKKQKRLYSYIDFLKNEKFLLWRFFPTTELDEYWTQFIGSNPKSKDAFQSAIKKSENIRLNDYKLSDNTKEKLYNRINWSVEQKNKKRRKIRNYFSVAAACLAILFVSSYFINNISSLKDIGFKQEAIIGQAFPSEDIQLVIDGNSTVLGQNVEIQLHGNKQASIVHSEATQVQLNLSEVNQNKLIVPYGRRSFLVLDDGSRIWINSGSELEFPSAFYGDTRNIKVKGEIYIEVAHVANKPFYVHTSDFDIKVYGTKFNVSSYDEEEESSVVLVEGKVEVRSGDENTMMLAPNEMFLNSGGVMEKHKVNVDEYVSWKNGYLLLNQTTLAEALGKISKYYNVEFEDHTTSLGEKTCTGKLFLSNSLDNVMHAVSAISNTDYERDNEKIYITQKQN